MGMYDTIEFLDNKSCEQLKCAAGHIQIRSSLQTKDLDCNLDYYYVVNNLLYLKLKNIEKIEEPPIVSGDSLIMSSKSEARFKNFSGTIEIYNSCDECLPIVIEGESSIWGRVHTRTMFNEWEVLFENGKLKNVIPVKVQTREELRQELIKNGVDGVLDDNDRIAKKHLEQYKAKGSREYW